MDSQKFLLLSDSHGDVSSLKEILLWAKNISQSGSIINHVVFLGDGIADFPPAANAAGFFSNCKFICGNNDWAAMSKNTVPETDVFDFSGHRFFMCHGHRHALYDGHYSLLAAARANNADAVLFGHTHVPYCKNIDGIMLINPGSIGRPRSRVGATFAVIECASNEMPKVEFWNIEDRKNIKRLKL